MCNVKIDLFSVWFCICSRVSSVFEIDVDRLWLCLNATFDSVWSGPHLCYCPAIEPQCLLCSPHRAL